MGLKNSKAVRYEKHNINVDLKNVYFESWDDSSDRAADKSIGNCRYEPYLGNA